MLRAKHAMTKDVISTTANKSVVEVLRVMSDNDIRHVPVVDENMTVVGIVSEGDILLRGKSVDEKVVLPDELLVADVMAKNVITCHPTSPLKNIAATMIACKIDCLPVVNDDILAGIVTTTDILDLFCMDEELNGHIVMPLKFSQNRRWQAECG